jgi:hypothetical protein
MPTVPMGMNYTNQLGTNPNIPVPNSNFPFATNLTQQMPHTTTPNVMPPPGGNFVPGTLNNPNPVGTHAVAPANNYAALQTNWQHAPNANAIQPAGNYHPQTAVVPHNIVVQPQGHAVPIPAFQNVQHGAHADTVSLSTHITSAKNAPQGIQYDTAPFFMIEAQSFEDAANKIESLPNHLSI